MVRLAEQAVETLGREVGWEYPDVVFGVRPIGGGAVEIIGAECSWILNAPEEIEEWLDVQLNLALGAV